MANTIWLDTASGTWGSTSDLVLVDLDAQKVIDALPGKFDYLDATSILDWIDTLSDAEISKFGVDFGTKLEGSPLVPFVRALAKYKTSGEVENAGEELDNPADDRDVLDTLILQARDLVVGEES